MQRGKSDDFLYHFLTREERELSNFLAQGFHVASSGLFINPSLLRGKGWPGWFTRFFLEESSTDQMGKT